MPVGLRRTASPGNCLGGGVMSKPSRRKPGVLLWPSTTRTALSWPQRAWLHDVGYVQELAVTGFHPLDGARWLRGRAFDSRVTALVAHHSGALIEAGERGMADQLATEFPREDSATANALWYCDMTTGPDGQDFEVVDRLGEIRSRYGPGHIVTRFIDRAQPTIVAAVRRAEDRLASLANRHPDP